MNRRNFFALAVALPMGVLGETRRGRGIDPARLGASTACLAGYSLLDALRELRQLGFSTVEIIAYTGAKHSVGEIPGFDLARASAREREQVFEATRAFRHISAHMPFQDVDLLARDAAVRGQGVARVKQALDGLAFLKGEMAVVHPGWPEKGVAYRDIWPQMLGTFRELGDYAGARGIRIGLETMQPASVDEYAQLVFDIDHPMVGATIDTGHIRGSSDIGLPPERRHSEEGRLRFNDVLQRVFDVLGDRVLHVHLSDVGAADWRDHRAIGRGIIDFPRVFRTLERMKFDGLLVFELEEQDQLAALRASKDLADTLIRGWRP